MRFASITTRSPQQPMRAPAVEPVRRVIADAPQRPQPVPARAEPFDLDQRVRLVGEW